MTHDRIAGKHWLVEFYGARDLSDVQAIRRAMKNAVAVSGATLLKLQLHHFGPGDGVTGVALLAESHVSIHTWPERQYAAVDIFMCGKTSSPAKALAALKAALTPRRVRVRRFARGTR
jgi:S-adenosylmethionine decarboxylase